MEKGSLGISVDTLPVGLAGCCVSGAVTVREPFAWFDIFFGRSRIYLVLCRVSGVESGLFEKWQKLCVLCLIVSASCEDVRMQD